MSDSEEETKKSESQLATSVHSLSKRGFIARRGRNNRLLVRPVLKHVFDDKFEGMRDGAIGAKSVSKGKLQPTAVSTCEYVESRVAGMGVNFILNKYREVMLNQQSVQSPTQKKWTQAIYDHQPQKRSNREDMVLFN